VIKGKEKLLQGVIYILSRREKNTCTTQYNSEVHTAIHTQCSEADTDRRSRPTNFFVIVDEHYERWHRGGKRETYPDTEVDRELGHGRR
jgi:hypothetical protein